MPDNRAELPKDGVIAGGLAQRLRDALSGCQPDPRRVRVEFVNDCAFEVDLTNTTPSETQQSEGAVSDTEIEEAANYEAPNRYQTYGLDVHKAFVGGAVFGAYLQRNIPRVRASNPTKQALRSPSKGKFVAIEELKKARVMLGALREQNEVPIIGSSIDCAIEALEGKALCSNCDTFTEVPE